MVMLVISNSCLRSKLYSVHEKLNLSFAVVAGPVCFLLALTVLLMEIFIPWEEDLDCWVGENSTK